MMYEITFRVQNHFDTLKNVFTFIRNTKKYRDTGSFQSCNVFSKIQLSLHLIVFLQLQMGEKGYAMSQDYSSAKDQFFPASRHQPRAQISILLLQSY